ncbi:MAG: hypothetical protein ACJAZ8_000891 [Planctomycetota bacterium]|jgi:hypothetical protein
MNFNLTPARLLVPIIGFATLVFALPPPNPVPGVTIAPPPLELQGVNTGKRVNVAPGMSVTSKFSTSGAYVRFNWQNDHGLTKSFMQSTSYHPTSVEPILRNGEIVFIVSGKNATNGNTVIEQWSLSTPGVQTSPTGLYKMLRGGGVRKVKSLYSRPVVGRDMVQNLWRDALNEDQIQIQFWDSKDIYKMDLVSRQLDLIASPNPSATGVTEAWLGATSHTNAWSRNHAIYGIVHVLDGEAGGGLPETWLVFTDLDRDGIPEGSFNTDEASWTSSGMGDGANYLD